MPENLRDHEKDMTDTTLNASASELQVALSQQSDKIDQDDNEDCMNESGLLVVTDGSDSFIYNQQAEKNDSSIERIQDDVDKNDGIGQCTGNLSPILELPEKTPEILMEYRKDSKKDVPTCNENNVVGIDENIKEVSQPLMPETTSELSRANSDAPSSETDLCFQFTTMLVTFNTSSGETRLNCPSGSDRTLHSVLGEKISKFFVKPSSLGEASNSIASNKTVLEINNVLDLGTKKAYSAFDNKDSCSMVEQVEDSLTKNESKPLKIGDGRTGLRYKKASEFKADCEPIPGSSKYLTDAEKCREKFCGRKKVNDFQPSCQLSSIIGDLNNNTTDDIKTDYNRNVSSDESLKEGFKNIKHENKISDFATKSSVKRNCDSQLGAPSTKHRRRCTTTGNSKTNEENKPKHHFRFISNDAKKCVSDKGTGQAGSSTSKSGIFQSGKHKVDTGSKTLIKEFSCNIKRFKKNETSSSEKESSGSKDSH